MGKSLIIVESPARAETINKYLGSQYVVKSGIGHTCDLPTSDSSSSKESAAKGRKSASEASTLSPREEARRQLVLRMGIDPEHGWKAKYETLPSREKAVDELRRLAKDADAIYPATDLNREGEAIAQHLRGAVGSNESRYRHVIFNEVTKKAIRGTFSQPDELDISWVNTQQMRRFLDRMVGYMVSPLLWQKIAHELSAGRVQSVAMKLVVERRREIHVFVPEECWEVHVDLGTAKGTNVCFEVTREKGGAFKPLNEAQAIVALERLKASTCSVARREDRPTSSQPSAPFIASTLQQAIDNRLDFGVREAMMMTQCLYEVGYITYMRTDSTNLSIDAIGMVRGFIRDESGQKCLPGKTSVYPSKESAQEVHEATRPSDVNLKPTQLSGVERDAERLYDLIWRQFVAYQITPAEYLSTSISITAGDFELRAKSRTLKLDGYTRVLPQQSRPSEDDVLPEMKEGENLRLTKLGPSQHFTKPPTRYSKVSLIKELKKRGINRLSTYVTIISTTQERGYVTTHNRHFYAEKMGDVVTGRLNESLANLMDYGFAAGMEEHLDDMAQGERNWKHLLDEFYDDFKKKLEVAEANERGIRADQPTLTNIPYRECGRPVMVHTASAGVFLGCSGYSLPPKERCKATVSLIPGDEIAADDEDESELRVLRSKHRCPICSTAMDAYLLDEKHKLHICGSNPDYPGYEIEEGQHRIKGYEGPGSECDRCGSKMQLETDRFGKFFGCTNSTCRNTHKLPKNGEAAPPKMGAIRMPESKCEEVDDIYVPCDGASGMFLAVGRFPKNRETRAPSVSKIIPHKAELDPKYHYLYDTPQKGPDGRPTVIRFSRKTREQYVQSEVDGRSTGWHAFYDGGKWRVEDRR